MKTAVWITAIALTLAAGARAYGVRDDGFPHVDHDRVFPVCTGCHSGIETGDTAAIYPNPERCARCHDGTTEEPVQWNASTREPSNLVFEHRGHTNNLGALADSVDCGTCHQSETDSRRMAVTRAVPEKCIACHAHDVPTHLATGADCRRCHIPLYEATRLSAERVADFPRADDHRDSTFLLNHAPQSNITCTVCHARESCERCHFNASSISVIADLNRDPRVAAMVGTKEPQYPSPETHASAAWAWSHSDVAESSSSGCSNCHAKESCQACHLDASLPQVALLPAAPRDGPHGVVFAPGTPSVHPAGFADAHGSQAVAAEQTCSGCHVEQVFCAECHDGAGSPAFHPGNFRERHGSQAYGGEADCSSCHNAEIFCRSCHAGNGLASDGSLDVAFHSARPFWLLGHGQAARQGLENCTTCHSQSDCSRCHSAVGAWRINPHGPDFDGSRAQDRNRLACLQCHRSGRPELP